MSASKLAADAARGIPGSTMVVAMARNGTEFGIQTASTGDRWFAAPAPMPDGLYLGGFGPGDANPDIGDSTITETSGIGGFAMAAAPAIVSFIGGQASDALQATRSMYEITLTEHPAYQIPILDFRGSPVGIDVTKVARTGLLPVVNTGIAGRSPGRARSAPGWRHPRSRCSRARPGRWPTPPLRSAPAIQRHEPAPRLARPGADLRSRTGRPAVRGSRCSASSRFRSSRYAGRRLRVMPRTRIVAAPGRGL